MTTSDRASLPLGYPPAFQRVELIRSARAEALGIPNIPTAQHEANLRALAWKILWPLREAMGGPIRVTSGYRSAAINRKIKGSSATSQHMLGQAADLVSGGPFRNATMFHYIRQYLPFDQLIWEYGSQQDPAWVHVSYRPNPRGKILVTTGTPEKPSYAPWRG
jgi:hypothetical protein